MDDYNPIKSVDGEAVKCPSHYQWKLQDISNSDAGRTEDTVMDKKRIGQCVKLELEWQNVTIADAAKILQKFNPGPVDLVDDADLVQREPDDTGLVGECLCRVSCMMKMKPNGFFFFVP